MKKLSLSRIALLSEDQSNLLDEANGLMFTIHFHQISMEHRTCKCNPSQLTENVFSVGSSQPYHCSIFKNALLRRRRRRISAKPDKNKTPRSAYFPVSNRSFLESSGIDIKERLPGTPTWKPLYFTHFTLMKLYCCRSVCDSLADARIVTCCLTFSS